MKTYFLLYIALAITLIHSAVKEQTKAQVKFQFGQFDDQAKKIVKDKIQVKAIKVLCSQKYSFRWDKEIFLTMGCNWMYYNKVCGYQFGQLKGRTYRNACIACYEHRKVKHFTYGKCK